MACFVFPETKVTSSNDLICLDNNCKNPKVVIYIDYKMRFLCEKQEPAGHFHLHLYSMTVSQ